MFAAVVFFIGPLLCAFGETLPRDARLLPEDNNAELSRKATFDELSVEEPDIDPAARREAFIDGNMPFPFADGRQVAAPTSGTMLENAGQVFHEVSTEILASHSSGTFRLTD